jgi:hypothetical protein
MTSENTTSTGSPTGDEPSASSDDTGALERLTPEPAPSPGRAATTRPASATDPTRRPILDWDSEPSHDVDPEDSRAGRADNLARLLDDVPPHHVDR